MLLWSLVILLGLAALAVSLCLHLPVRLAAQYAGGPVAADSLSGTVWHGAARLPTGHAARWATDPAASLRARALVVNWRLTGPGADLAGPAQVWPQQASWGASIGPLAGTLGWPAVAALLPGLPIACNGAAVLADVRLTLAPGTRSAAGRITADAATCGRTDGTGPAVPSPALTAIFADTDDGIGAVVTTRDAPDTPLATVRLTLADRLIVTLHAAGAAFVPGLPSSADSEIELPLAALVPGLRLP